MIELNAENVHSNRAHQLQVTKVSRRSVQYIFWIDEMKTVKFSCASLFSEKFVWFLHFLFLFLNAKIERNEKEKQKIKNNNNKNSNIKAFIARSALESALKKYKTNEQKCTINHKYKKD